MNLRLLELEKNWKSLESKLTSLEKDSVGTLRGESDDCRARLDELEQLMSSERNTQDELSALAQKEAEDREFLTRVAQRTMQEFDHLRQRVDAVSPTMVVAATQPANAVVIQDLELALSEEARVLAESEVELYKAAAAASETRRNHVFVAFMKLDKLARDSDKLDIEAVRQLLDCGLRRRSCDTRRIVKRRPLKEVLKTRTCRECGFEKTIEHFKTYSSTHRLCHDCHLAVQRDRYHRKVATQKLEAGGEQEGA